MINEKILLNYLHNIQYLNDPLNVIGATTNATLRTIATHNDTNSKYVRKFGINYAINDITNAVISTPRSDGGGTNKWWYEFYNESDTLLATVKDENGVSTFVDGTAEASSRVYIKIVRKAGNTNALVDGDTIALTTDIDAPLTVYISGESIGVGDPDVLLALSATGSTYYMESVTDITMKYGGFRHTPTGVAKFPFFHPILADSALGGAFVNVIVLDSQTYEVNDYAVSNANSKWQAELGETPTITNGVGARVTREVSQQYNNSGAIYWNTNGNDTTGNGDWQNPYLTPQKAIDNSVTDDVIYGGAGAENNIVVNISATILLKTSQNFETDYGYLITIIPSTSLSSMITEAVALTTIIDGFIFDANSLSLQGIFLGAATVTYTIRNCTLRNFPVAAIIATTTTGKTVDLTANNNLISNCSTGIFINNNLSTRIITAFNNIIFNCGTGIYFAGIQGVYNNSSIYNNNIYNITADGIRLEEITATSTFDVDIYNNTIFNVTHYGIWLQVAALDTIAAWNNICHTCIDHGFFSLVAITITFHNFFNNGTDFNGNVTSNNQIAGDPKLCKLTDPVKFGLSADSPCYRADSGGDDTGTIFRLLEINESSIEINGFNIDGQESYNNAIYIKDAGNHIGLILKWNSIFDFQGIQIDPYDNDTDTDCEIKNNEIYNGGNGIKLSRGGNTIEENLIYNNIIFGVWSDYTAQTFNHNVFFGNLYGIYFESNSGAITIKNSIFHSNGLFDIFSEVSISITFCCITGAVNNVDITAGSNIIDDPLLLNELPGTEDFHLKTESRRFTFESPCVNVANDGLDIGAYAEIRSIDEESWKTFQFYNNPLNLDPDRKLISRRKFTNAFGTSFLYGAGRRRIFPFNFSADDDQTEDQVDRFEELTGIIQDLENQYKEDEVRVRLSLLPSQKILSGTNATLTGLVLEDLSLDLKINKYSGFWIGLKFTTGTGMVVDAGTRTATDSGASWTANQWRRHYLPLNNTWFLIKSNTTTILTLSDPLGQLTDQTINYSIEKYFLITQNNENQFQLKDDDNELVDGTYDYYIQFIEAQVMSDRFQPKSFGYFFQKFRNKTGFSLILEEKK